MSSTKLQVIPKQMTANGQRVAVESDTTLVPARSVEALAGTIRHEHDLVLRAGQRMLDHAIKCGDALCEVKRRLPKGTWMRWAEENLPFTTTTASFYMRASTYVEILNREKIDTWAAARGFLQEHHLVINGEREAAERLTAIRRLSEQGLTARQIAGVLEMSPKTVYAYLDPRSTHSRRRCRTGPPPTGPRRRSGRQTGDARRRWGPITDDLVEGAAIKLREIYGSTTADVTDSDRDAAAKVLRAAFTYDGPIPGDAA